MRRRRVRSPRPGARHPRGPRSARARSRDRNVARTIEELGGAARALGRGVSGPEVLERDRELQPELGVARQQPSRARRGSRRARPARPEDRTARRRPRSDAPMRDLEHPLRVSAPERRRLAGAPRVARRRTRGSSRASRSAPRRAVPCDGAPGSCRAARRACRDRHRRPPRRTRACSRPRKTARRRKSVCSSCVEEVVRPRDRGAERRVTLVGVARALEQVEAARRGARAAPRARGASCAPRRARARAAAGRGARRARRTASRRPRGRGGPRAHARRNSVDRLVVRRAAAGRARPRPGRAAPRGS